MANFAATYQPFACANDEVNNCRQAGKPLTRTDFVRMSNYAEGAAELTTILPETESLITCKFVQVTLKDLTDNYCDDCVKTLDTLWIGFLLVGVGLFVCWFVMMSAQAHMIKGGHVGDQFSLEMSSVPK